MAAASGLAVQWIHTTRERRNDIKKIRDLLKPDFEELYRLLVNECQTVKNARLSSAGEFRSLRNYMYEANISVYLGRVGGFRFKSLVWNAITTSGKLINMEKDEIETIQSVQEGVIHYNERMVQLQNKASLELKKELKTDRGITSLHTPNMAVLERYLDEYERNINNAVERFKDLGNLPWFDYDKIKDTGPRCKAS